MVKHSRTQQIKARPTIHLALQGLEPVDLSLQLSIAPRALDAGDNRLQIRLNACREVLYFTDTAAQGLLYPLTELSAVVCLYKMMKGLAHSLKFRGPWNLLKQLITIGLVPIVDLSLFLRQ